MDIFDQLISELLATKDAIEKKREATLVDFAAQLEVVDKDIEAVERTKQLSLENLKAENNTQIEKTKTSNGSQFTPKGIMSIPDAVTKSICEAKRPLSLDDLETTIKGFDMDVKRSTIRSILTKYLGIRYKRVDKGIYDVI